MGILSQHEGPSTGASPEGAVVASGRVAEIKQAMAALESALSPDVIVAANETGVE